jgi:hypothetical protein
VEVRLDHSCRDELHGRALDRLGDRLGVPEVILLSPRIRAHVLRRHYASVVSEHLQLAAEITAAGLASRASTGRTIPLADMVALIDTPHHRPYTQL